MAVFCPECKEPLTWTLWGAQEHNCMARVCIRCGKQGNWTDEHLCDDVRRRLARREKQRDAVVAILEREVLEYGENTDLHVAEEIIAKLNQLGVTDDT